MLKTMVLICILAFAAGCSEENSATDAPSTENLTAGIDKANMDTEVRPQDDFFEYVNGTWLRESEIPADQTRAGGFIDLREQSREDVLVIIQDLSSQSDMAMGSDEQKVADMYNSYMDSTGIEQQGLAPLQAELDAIDGIKSKKALAPHFSHLAQIGGGGAFFPYVTVDAKDATKYALYFWQGGIGLPDRDYYFKDDEKSVTLRDEYVKHIEKMFALAEWNDPAGSAQALMALETSLAGNHRNNVENRDSEKRYNKYKVSTLHELGDEMDWAAYFAKAGVTEDLDVIVNQPEFITGFNQALADASLADWKLFLKWNLLNSYAGSLNSAFDQQNFAFYSNTLNGQEKQKDRWKRGVDNVNGSLGEVIGKVYVSKHFKPAAKTRMLDLVENLRTAYGEAINGLEWMSPDTREQALIKLASFTPKVGYPDIWEDYSRLEIKPGDLVGNQMRANAFQWVINREKLGNPIRDHEWGMTPQTVNAYYSPTRNEIVFPAAILQPPFFNMSADDAVNYGAIGSVIGHEMGHGFDDQGSRYDADGNLRNWWTENDLAEFKKRTDALVEQYNQYAVFDDLNVNGELTLGENIGDLAGMTIAWRAYQNSLNGEVAPVIDGWSGDERFFLGFAQVWQSKSKDEAMRNRVLTDPHSPPRYRVLGTLSNMPEFAQTFGVVEGDKMYVAPEDQVKVW
ncbi:MAG: putative endopeptidase [Candidatus Krumholzibacteriia bacterium]|jgi:putative endopeptidase